MADDKNNIANVPTATLENEYIAALVDEIDRLRAAGDALADVVKWAKWVSVGDDESKALRAWEEARRG